MKKITRWIVGACAAFALISTPVSMNAQSLSPSTKWHWEKGTIVIDTPERPAGQQHALGLKAPKLNVVRVAFVGLGMRGPGAVERFTYIPGVQIVALCDYEKDRAEKCQDILRKASLPPAAIVKNLYHIYGKALRQKSKNYFAGNYSLYPAG